MGNEWIAPAITGVLLLVTGTTAELIRRRNAHLNSVDTRAPSTTQAWNETDRARERMHAFEDLFYAARSALKHLMRTVKDKHPDYEFTPDVTAAALLEPPDDEPAPR